MPFTCPNAAAPPANLHEPRPGHRPDAVDRLALGAEAVPARAARARTAEVCRRRQLGHLADDAALVVSELVTNALEHAAGDDAEVSLTLLVADDALVAEVADADPNPPVLRHPEPWAESGRGLWLVGVLASAWGVRREAGGKVVWARLSAAG